MNKQISFAKQYVRTHAEALCWAMQRSTGNDLDSIPGLSGFKR